jgi:hypothetical protein
MYHRQEPWYSTLIIHSLWFVFPSFWQLFVSDWPTRALALELICIAIKVNGLLKPMYRDRIELSRPLFAQIQLVQEADALINA